MNAKLTQSMIQIAARKIGVLTEDEIQRIVATDDETGLTTILICEVDAASADYFQRWIGEASHSIGITFTPIQGVGHS
jgi:hypothetical protein